MRFSSLDGVRRVKRNSVMGGVMGSIVIFVAVLILFLTAISKTTENSVEQQRESLSAAVNRCLLQSYVTEGRYPESFEVLQKKYGIIYDKEKFRVDYIVYGSNMRPDVTIIELEDRD